MLQGVFFFFHYFLATSMTSWAQIFTDRLFDAHVGTHQVRRLVFDNYKRCPVPFRMDFCMPPTRQKTRRQNDEPGPTNSSRQTSPKLITTSYWLTNRMVIEIYLIICNDRVLKEFLHLYVYPFIPWDISKVNPCDRGGSLGDIDPCDLRPL